MKVKLGELTKIRTGKLDANASSPDGEYPFFTCSKEPLKISSYSYDCECVLVAGNGDLNVKYYNGKFDAYQRTYIIEDNSNGRLYLPYLYYFMNGYVEELRKLSIGGVIKYIKLRNLTDALIELPDIETQKYIVSILSKIKELIDSRYQELKILENLIKARFVEMFGDNDKKIAISSLCDVSGGYSFKSEDISSTGFIKILQIGNVYLDDVNWETTNYLPKGFDNVYSRFLLNEGDIVIALTRPIIQSLGNVKACIVKVSDTPCLLNQRVGRIVSKKNVDVNLKFIYGCLMTDDFTRYVESCCIGCSQPNISTKDIENYMIPDASYEKQMDFVKFKEQVDKSKATVQKALDETQLLFDSLMQQYFG